jgi:uncharacterized protein YvpB
MSTRLAGLALALTLLLSLPAVVAADVGVRQLDVPYRSQMDGSPDEDGNCGPATMAMVLGAYGQSVSNAEMRALVNDLQDTWGLEGAGTFIENLAIMGQIRGLRAWGLVPEPLTALAKPPGKNTLRRWTLAQLRAQLDAGFPVVPQVRYRDLPGHEKSDYWGDHYIVVTGYVEGAFIYNDPVDKYEPGFARRIPSAQLDKAWRSSSFPYAGVSFAGADGEPVPPAQPTPTYGILRRLNAE